METCEFCEKEAKYICREYFHGCDAWDGSDGFAEARTCAEHTWDEGRTVLGREITVRRIKDGRLNER
jgi:hypothetical protein